MKFICLYSIYFQDPNAFKKTGRILLTGDLGKEYGFKDIDGIYINSESTLHLCNTYKLLVWRNDFVTQ